MQTIVHWSDWDRQGLEHCAMRQTGDGIALDGVVIGTRDGRYAASYAVRTDASLRTRDVRVAYIGGPELHITADGNGTWHDALSDQPLPLLAGCLDVDIGVTPATNTLPIKRLQLECQQSQDIAVAYIPLPSQIDAAFLPRPAAQRYTCLTPERLYRYEGLFRGFTAELEIDSLGLVLDYPETFRRLAI